VKWFTLEAERFGLNCRPETLVGDRSCALIDFAAVAVVIMALRSSPAVIWMLSQ
jgi:hypothetical protein